MHPYDHSCTCPACIDYEWKMYETMRQEKAKDDMIKVQRLQEQALAIINNPKFAR